PSSRCVTSSTRSTVKTMGIRAYSARAVIDSWVMVAGWAGATISAILGAFMGDIRRRHEDPSAIARLGWRFHHLGIPHGSPRRGERHLEQLGIHVCGFETSPYGIEWMRFDPQCPVPEVVKTLPHLAFVVDDLDTALEGREILI